MRISELLQLPVDCLTQVTHGVSTTCGICGRQGETENAIPPFHRRSPASSRSSRPRGAIMTSLRCGYSRMSEEA